MFPAWSTRSTSLAVAELGSIAASGSSGWRPIRVDACVSAAAGATMQPSCWPWRNRRSVTSSRIWRWLPAEVTATARYGPTQPLRRACRSGCAWPDCGRADPNDGLHDDRLLAALEDHGWAGSRQRPSTSRSSRTRKRERGRSRVPDSVSEVRSPSRSSGDTTKWTSIPGRVILRLLLAAAEELVTGHGERRHAAISE